MEEADLLADSVVIMKKGQVAACGSPLQLKSEHGSSIQFSLLIDQENLEHTVGLIRERFSGFEEWVEIQQGGTGNASVIISKILSQESDGMSPGGVDVETLADFVSFMESEDSSVREFGFSNSSLEEVFLKVTKSHNEGETDDNEQNNDSNDNTDTADIEDNVGERDSDVVFVDRKAVSGIGSYESNLTVRGQMVALLKFLVIRDWTGRSSIVNWLLHGLMLCLSVIIAISAAEYAGDPSGILVLIVFTVSINLWTLVTSIYNERSTGLFYLTRAQGMLKNAFILSQSLYAYALSVIFTFVVLSFVYATPLFRMSEVCERPPECDDSPWICESDDFCKWKYGDREKIRDQHQVGWWNDEYEGQSVQLYARRSPGHYGLILGLVAVFPLSMPGSMFACSHFPGQKIGITIFSLVLVSACMLPWIISIISSNRDGINIDGQECRWNICNTTFSGSESTVDGEEFLNCVGLDLNDAAVLCIATKSGLLPQIGVFQALYMALMSEITFTSDPPGYVEAKLLPTLTGDIDCNGPTCQFPYAREQYAGFVGFMVLGAIILAVFGFLLLSVLSYPGKTVLQWKSSLLSHLGSFFHPCRARISATKDGDLVMETPQEVLAEVEVVNELVAPFVETTLSGDSKDAITRINDFDAIPRDEIPPLVACKLRKEYALPGGFSTKVALANLDLQVPKGQVLGLLGKNGAGKSTALNIFAGGHEASSGVALVAGYDIALEQIQAFERLGNCAQFDVIWPWESVKVHLEFFGGLKGLPMDRIGEIAHAIASSVGLGSPEVYMRRAGALSGGMRRRLSIAISLIGAPRVLLLDEPSKCLYHESVSFCLVLQTSKYVKLLTTYCSSTATGLDPSTRTTIWDLIGSFSTENRAIVISKHQLRSSYVSLFF